MKQKTPLLEAIEKIKLIGLSAKSPYETSAYAISVGILTELLSKEKKVIEEAYLTACTEYSQTETALQSDIKAFKTYFNETFTQK